MSEKSKQNPNQKEGENLKKCPKNQNKIQIKKCESNSSLSVDPWLILYRSLKPFFFSIFSPELR